MNPYDIATYIVPNIKITHWNSVRLVGFKYIETIFRKWFQHCSPFVISKVSLHLCLLNFSFYYFIWSPICLTHLSLNTSVFLSVINRLIVQWYIFILSHLFEQVFPFQIWAHHLCLFLCRCLYFVFIFVCILLPQTDDLWLAFHNCQSLINSVSSVEPSQTCSFYLK